MSQRRVVAGATLASPRLGQASKKKLMKVHSDLNPAQLKRHDQVKAILSVIAPAPVLDALSSSALTQQKASDEQRLRKMTQWEQATAAPVQEHQRLAALTGKWNIEVKLWPGAAATPVVLKGVCL